MSRGVVAEGGSRTRTTIGAGGTTDAHHRQHGPVDPVRAGALPLSDDLPVPPTTVTSPWLRIQTDAGLAGTCFGATDVVDAGIEAVKSLLVGEDPLNRERLWHRFWKAARWRGFQGTLGTVDVALWGLFGQAATLPVYMLLGGTATTSRHMPAHCQLGRRVRSRSGPMSNRRGPDRKRVSRHCLMRSARRC